MDNTKDPVRVLREANDEMHIAKRISCEVEGSAEEKFLRYLHAEGYSGEVGGSVAHDTATVQRMRKVWFAALAAIPHSEQRETVAAVEVPKSNDGKEQDAFEAWAKGERYDMATHPMHWLFLNERTYAARQGWKAALDYAGSVLAAPVPEAKAEQGQCYSMLTVCPTCDNKIARCVMLNAAPAVKHEASELVPLPDVREANRFSVPDKDLRKRPSELPPLPVPFMELLSQTVMNAWAEQMRTYGQACVAQAQYEQGEAERAVIYWKAKAKQVAPPIAVQGSIADDAEFHELLDNYCDSDRSDYEKCLTAFTDYITEWADSRSPVAAAPRVSAEQWKTQAELLVKIIESRDASDKRLCAWMAKLPRWGRGEFDSEYKVREKGEFLMRDEVLAIMSAAAPSADAEGASRG